MTGVFALLLVVQHQRGVTLPLLSSLENQLLDLKFRIRGPEPVWPEQVIIGIDERSLARLGRHPWPRYVYLDLFLKLAQLKPRAVGMDLTFADPDRTAEEAVKLFQEVQGKYREFYPKPNPQFEAFAKETENKLQIDQNIAEALTKIPNVVGGFYNIYNPEEAKRVKISEADLYRILDPSEIKAVMFEEVQERTLPHSEALRTDIPIIAAAIQKQGFVELVADRDGAIRRSQLIMQRDLHFYPSLPFQLASVVRGEEISLEFGKEGVERLALGNQKIPVDRFGQIFINWTKKNPIYPVLSFYDVAYGDIDPSLVQNKVVWIGITSPVIAKETFKTSFSPFTPGVQIHANVTDNIVNANYLARSKSAWIYELIVVLLFCFFFFFSLIQFNPLWAMVSTLGAMAGVFFGDALFLFSRNLLFNDTIPLVQAGLTYLVVTAYRFFVEEKDARRVKNAFRHYVAPAVADQIMTSKDELRLGGEKKILTVLFSDIRNFTPLSEKLPPDQLTHFLNDFMTRMTEAIFAHHGLLDKYMGDALLAIFGAPIPDPMHPMHACEAADAMIKLLPALRKDWPIDAIDCGIGIHTGEMIVGNMGSKDVFDYTVVGDNVNLGARLEKSNKIYGTHIILSEETYKQVQVKVLARELDLILMRGKGVPSRIYELVAIGEGSPTQQQLVKGFQEGLSSYRSMKWKEAIQDFQTCLKLVPGDIPSKLFIKRCESFSTVPPEEGWSGVYLVR